MNTLMHAICSVLFVAIAWSPIAIAKDSPPFTPAWADNKPSIYGESIPGGELKIYQIEAYSRPGSTVRIWNETTIGHKTKIILQGADKTSLQLLCILSDGVTVKHSITFGLEIHNPMQTLPQAHWAQPCVWVPLPALKIIQKHKRTKRNALFFLMENNRSCPAKIGP